MGVCCKVTPVFNFRRLGLKMKGGGEKKEKKKLSHKSVFVSLYRGVKWDALVLNVETWSEERDPGFL